MRMIQAKSNCLLLHDDGTIHYPFSKFLTEKFVNPNTRELVSQSLKILYRFCIAYRIEFGLRGAIEGRCLTYDECNKLANLCFRPLEELESLSDKKIVSISSAKSGKKPQSLPKAMEPNTAKKRLHYIAQYLDFYDEVFLSPSVRSRSLREDIRTEYLKNTHQLRTKIKGTKQGHHHNIQSLPSIKFLEIIRSVFLYPEDLFLTASGKLSRNLFRSRAMVLLACEGLRPGTLGNIARSDFRPDSSHLIIKDNRERREKITSSTPLLKLGSSTQINSASETMIELWPFTIEAIRQYIELERTSVVSKGLKKPE